MFEGFVFEDCPPRDSNTEPLFSAFPFSSLIAQYVERLGFVEIHRVFERGRPDLRVELRRLQARVPPLAINPDSGKTGSTC